MSDSRKPTFLFQSQRRHNRCGTFHPSHKCCLRRYGLLYSIFRNLLYALQKPHTTDIPRSDETGVIAVYKDICCGNEDCIVYPVTTWPSSVLAYDDEMLYKELPATEPPFSSLTMEAPDYSFVFEVAASYADFVTVSDVLEAIYQNRNHFDKQWFHGLYWAGDRLCLQVHVTDTD